MTTATPPSRPLSVAPGVRGAAIATVLVGTVAVALAATTSGRPEALGALIGGVMVLGTFGFGAVTVNAVAGVLPSASLLVALLTYTLQVVVLGMLFWGLTRGGATDGDIDASWLGGTAIAATLAWLAGQVTGAMRARQPIYDLKPSAPPSGSETGGGEQVP